MAAYYNEFDKKAAAWLRELIKAGLIASGDVDERSIEDVRPDDLVGYTQCHFFAGIGGWSYALRLAGWPDDRPVWTGSCPCQPFSAAGKGKGFIDKRHLWPAWFHLIAQCRPPVVFGEQVASKDGLMWFDLVHTDLERAGYAVGAADLCAAGVGAPHIRQRLWFVGHTIEQGLEGYGGDGDHGNEPGWIDTEQDGPTAAGATGGVADSCGAASERNTGSVLGTQAQISEENGPQHGDLSVGHSNGCATGGVADAERQQEHEEQQRPAEDETGRRADGLGRCGMVDTNTTGSPTNGFWQNADWLYCRDELWRPVEPGAFPLVNGIPGRVGLLRGYGNAIVPQVSAEVIGAYMDSVIC